MRDLSILLVSIALTNSSLVGQSAPGELLDEALRRPDDQRTVELAISAHSKTNDPVAISKLRTVFRTSSQKKLRQELAVLLTNVGQREDEMFQELLKYAEEAVTTDAPLPFFMDANGNAIKGEIPLEFTNWCKVHDLEIDPCMQKVLGYSMDVYYLAIVKDRRAVPVLRRGLESANSATVSFSVIGLAELGDNESIPVIASNIRRLRPLQRTIVASELARFDDPRVSSLLDEFVRDPQWRRDIDESIQKRRGQLPPSNQAK